jgi:hypothetical protein
MLWKGKTMNMSCIHCEHCKAKVTQLQLDRVNNELSALPLYHETSRHALAAVNVVLAANCFNEVEHLTQRESGVFHAHVEVGGGKWATITLFRMASGRYELTAYVS